MDKARSAGIWLVLLLLAILCIVGAVQGTHGRMLAALFAPVLLQRTDG